EVQRVYAGKSAEQIVAFLQSTKAYRDMQRRRWADRFSYSDAVVPGGEIKGLDALVLALYEGRTSYPDFATIALAHPAFVSRFNGYGDAPAVATAAFQIFLGRRATPPEAEDLGNLWHAWPGNYPIGEDKRDSI